MRFILCCNIHVQRVSEFDQEILQTADQPTAR